MKSSKWCHICKMELKSAIHAQKHYYSSNHSKKFQQLREAAMNKILVSPIKNGKSQCKICNLSVYEDVLASGHLNSETHKRNSEVYCTICEVKTVSKEALLEHRTNSLSHLEKAKITMENPSEHSSEPKAICLPEVVAKDPLSIPLVCVTPKLPPKRSTKKLSKAAVVKRSSPKKNDKNGEKWQIFCSICNLYYLSEQFSTHITEFAHVVLDRLTNECSYEIVREFCSITDGKYLLCSLCNVVMQGPSDAESHLNSIKHIKRFKAKFPEHVSEDSKISIKGNGTSSIGKNVTDQNGKFLVKSSDDKIVKETLDLNENIKPTEFHKYYCYICRLEFASAMDVNVHTVTFPHVSMAKWKSQAVSLGVSYAEYWRQSKNSFICTLCDFEVKTEAASKSHMNDSKHQTLLTEWCREFASWKFGAVVDPKYFYCKVCNLSLLGTSEVFCHYNTEVHLKREALHCKTSHTTKKIPLAGLKTNEDKENISEEALDKVDSTHKVEDHVDGKPPIVDLTCVSMESQLFQQAERLVHTLYYSKTVPVDVALQYLKQINSEVAELDQKYDKSNVKAKLVDKCNILNENSKNSNGIVHALDKRNKKEYKINSFLLNKHTGEGVLKVTIEENQNLQKLPDVSAEEQETAIKDESDHEFKDNQALRHGTGKYEESESFLLVENNFLNMYLNIMELRRAAGPSTERDVLDQIQKLVKAVNATEAPLDKMLALLQNFSHDLDSAAVKFKKKDRRATLS